MNQIGEQIEIKKMVCREFDVNELMSLLKSKIFVFFSWGCERFTVDKTKGTKMLCFKVNGYKHTGFVYIFLNFLDLFDVVLTDKSGKIVDRTDEMGLYFDQLVDWIDDKVERQPEYVD
jgi:hypothetical protein